LGLIPGLGTLGVPLLRRSDEEKRSGLCTLVHIKCGVTIKYCISPKNSLKKKIIMVEWIGHRKEVREVWGSNPADGKIFEKNAAAIQV